jgi:hypothetical protein
MSLVLAIKFILQQQFSTEALEEKDQFLLRDYIMHFCIFNIPGKPALGRRSQENHGF